MPGGDAGDVRHAEGKSGAIRAPHESAAARSTRTGMLLTMHTPVFTLLLLLLLAVLLQHVAFEEEVFIWWLAPVVMISLLLGPESKRADRRGSTYPPASTRSTCG